MKKLIGFVVLAMVAAALFSLSSCAHSSELVAITIEPGTETIGSSAIPVSDDAGSQVQLRALGTYIHPPVTKDITNEVTWTSNTPQMFTVNSAGLLTATGLSCGSTLVSATLTTNSSAGGISSSGSLVTGYMTGSVVCFTGSGVPLTVVFAGTGTGSVASNPPGLSCFSTATNCVGVFTSGSNVAITASPSGTFGGWAGCDSVTGNGLVCIIDDLTNPVSVTATFD
jgi:hypothetical protein